MTTTSVTSSKKLELDSTHHAPFSASIIAFIDLKGDYYFVLGRYISVKKTYHNFA